MKKAGNASKVWNEELVHSLCRKLQNEGLRPTVGSVRAKAGITTGSDSTVQRFINSFWDLPEAAKEEQAVPEPLTTALASLWDQAMALAKSEVETDRARVKEAQHQIKEERIALLSAMLKAEEKESTAIAALDDQQQKSAQLSALIDNQKNELASVYRSMERLQMENTQLAQQHQAAEDAKKALSDDLKRAHKAFDAAQQQHALILRLATSSFTEHLDSLSRSLEKSCDGAFPEELSNLIQQMRNDVLMFQPNDN